MPFFNSRAVVLICTDFLLLVAFGSAALPQTTSSEILGLLTDPSGAAIPGARVSITRAATGEVRNTTTSAAGDYSFPAVDIGEWTIHVEAPGFKSQTMTGVRVETQQKARVDFKLEVGAVTETVEVSAQMVSLETEDATVGQVIEHVSFR